MARSRRTIRVCVLFTGVTLSLASVPSMLERIDGVTDASRKGLHAAPTGGIDARTTSLIERAQRDAEFIHGDRDVEDVLRSRERGARVVRVLGPDD